MIRQLIDAKVFTKQIEDQLESKWYKTKAFLDLINSDKIFEESPFLSVLPVNGWEMEIETVDYSDLECIRELRNKFIHGVESSEITEDNISKKQSNYMRSMWILRKFAENVFFESKKLLGNDTNGKV